MADGHSPSADWLWSAMGHRADSGRGGRPGLWRSYQWIANRPVSKPEAPPAQARSARSEAYSQRLGRPLLGGRGIPMRAESARTTARTGHAALSKRIEAVQRWLCAIYRLELPLEASRFLMDAECARALLPRGGPRSGVLLCEEGEELWLGLYLDPRDHQDTGTLVEETSHLLCLAWHALQERRVSKLCLELQAEVDRYALARATGGDPLDHFERFRWLPNADPAARERYRTSHRAAYRYCRGLSRRFPRRADMPGLLAELRAFYRVGTHRKLHVALD